MKFLKTVYEKVLLPASFIFSLLVLLILLIQNASDTENKTIAFFGLIYLALIVIFASGLIFKTKLNTALKVAFHYIMTAGSITLYFVIFTKLGGNLQENRIFTLFLITTALYFIISIPVLIVQSKKKKKKNEEEDYKSQFGR